MASCKQKTHKATSKVVNKKKNGTLTFKKSNGNHKTAKDSSKAVRQRKNKGVYANSTKAKKLSRVI